MNPTQAVLSFFFSLGITIVSAQTIPSPAPEWTDDRGKFINAHGGGMLFDNGTYYWYGEIKSGKTHLVPGQSWEDYRVDAGGIGCYSSRDLRHWTFQGVALATEKTDTSSELYIGRVVERPKVIYNRRTGKYVMWVHIDREDYSYAHAGVAVSDKPMGPFTYVKSYRPAGQESRDMTIFQDADGAAYIIHASENNNTMRICQLSEDYLSPTDRSERIFIGERREAPAMFSYQGKYYLITSLCSGWDPNPARYAVADRVMGKWRQVGNPCLGKDSATTFMAQSTYVLPIPKKPGNFIFMADRWNKADLERSQYVWLPLRVKNGRVEISEEFPK
jgi:Glycosyl hydrolases family 43